MPSLVRTWIDPPPGMMVVWPDLPSLVPMLAHPTMSYVLPLFVPIEGVADLPRRTLEVVENMKGLVFVLKNL